ncbi:MAG: cytochrome-c oxidase, cbb3-type subunit III [Loktanella sp.]|nr:cytochrome-c oxidase, cbb3-type subunit III [Loktanella sp.]
MSDRKIDKETGVETTGHNWDGIEELNNPLPRWWLWTFYITIIWAIGYTIAYPAWPMISGATAGVMGYSTRAEVTEAIAAHEERNVDLVASLNQGDLNVIEAGSDLHRYATARGGAVFRAQCSQCHGAGAAGATGYPNLLDDAWLWGDYDATLASAGESIFMDNCAACHGEDARGNRMLGAPNLSDEIWLYGGDRDTLEYTVRNARFGVMPAWGQRLSEEDVRAVSIYVHALGGGE